MSDSAIFLVNQLQDRERLVDTIDRSLMRNASAHALSSLPNLTNIALGDPYLAEQLTALHRHWEIVPRTGVGLLARLRTRLAWWLFGHELRHANQVHASLVRILDSLIVQLDQERAARRRIEEHLAYSEETA